MEKNGQEDLIDTVIITREGCKKMNKGWQREEKNDGRIEKPRRDNRNGRRLPDDVS